MRRAVVEVVTPGLIGDPAGLDARAVVAVASVYIDSTSGAYGLAVLDASTGDFRATEFDGQKAEGPDPDSDVLPDALVQELARIGPRELLLPIERAELAADVVTDLIEGVAIRPLPENAFEPRSKSENWPGDFMDAKDPASRAAIAVANYLAENQPFAVENPPRLRRYEIADTVVLDAATRRHLELHENSEDRGRSGTLISELDATSCALGARRLSHWLSYPLLSPAEITVRQDKVAWLVEKDGVRGQLREAMSRVRDLDRLLSKATRPGAVPRDLGALRSSLKALPDVIAAAKCDEFGDSTDVMLLSERREEGVSTRLADTATGADPSCSRTD